MKVSRSGHFSMQKKKALCNSLPSTMNCTVYNVYMPEWLKVKVAISQCCKAMGITESEREMKFGINEVEGFYLSTSTDTLQTHLNRINNFYLIAQFWIVFTFSHSCVIHFGNIVVIHLIIGYLRTLQTQCLAILIQSSCENVVWLQEMVEEQRTNYE